MDNLYKRKFPKRSKHETVVDILRLNESQFKQFQDVAGQYMGGALLHKKIRRPRKKLLPSSLHTIHNVDSPQTLAALIGIQQSAHNDINKDFHEGGGLLEATSSIFNSLWNTIGLGPEFQDWFNFFDYDSPENKISSDDMDYARIVDQSYKEVSERSDIIDDWVRDKEFDTDRFSVWVDEDDKEVHVSLRGTKKNVSDIVSDLHILWDNTSGKAHEVKDFIEQVVDKYPEYKIDAAAHSLGGNQLLDVAINNPDIGVDTYHLFNPGLNPSWGLDEAKDAVNDERFKFYLNSGDIISNGFVPLLNDETNVTWSKPGHSPLSNHGIGQWYDDEI